MKTMKRLLPLGLLLPLALASCDGQKNKLEPTPDADGLFSLSDVARILSDLPCRADTSPKSTTP